MKVFVSFLVVAFIILCSSCEELLEVTDISEQSVELVAPSDSTTVLQSNVNFTWTEVFEATQYRLQVAAPDFENTAQLVVDTLIVVDSSFVISRLNQSLVDSDYEWRVKAENSAYETEFSAAKFTVNTTGN